MHDQLASELAEDDPAAAIPVLDEADAAAAASGMRSFASWPASLTQRWHARPAISSTRSSSQRPPAASFSSWWTDAVRLSELRCAPRRGRGHPAVRRRRRRASLRASPGPAAGPTTARHRLDLLDGQPASSTAVCETCRSAGLRDAVARRPESIDAGAADVAVDWRSYWARPEPHPQAVFAAIEGAATGNEDRWHDALAIALDHDLRLIAVDALEGSPSPPAEPRAGLNACGSSAPPQRSATRPATGGVSPSNNEPSTLARTAAVDALGDDARPPRPRAVTSTGARPPPTPAAPEANEATPARLGQPHPTEHQVVALVAEGMTNPQIAERLLMGRATVKTHLEHIFTKLDIRTRAALAAEATRRSSPPA